VTAPLVIAWYMPLNSPEGVFITILSLTVVGALVVAGFLSARGKRYVPVARRKGSSENKKLLSGKKPGEKTARILGSSNEVRQKEKSPGTLERGLQMRQKGIYFRIP